MSISINLISHPSRPVLVRHFILLILALRLTRFFICLQITSLQCTGEDIWCPVVFFPDDQALGQFLLLNSRLCVLQQTS